MPRVDPFGNRCTHCVRIHVRQMENNWVSPSVAITNAQRFYGSNGIYLEVASMLSTRLNPADYFKFTFIRTDCQWGQESRVQSDLFSQMAASDYQGILVVFVFAIDTPTGELEGCAGHSPHRAAVVVRSASPPWALAHEIGHVLLGPSFVPVHSTAAGNIMGTEAAILSSSQLPRFDFAQLEQVRRSPYLLRC